MKINGSAIAEEIYLDLRKRTAILKAKGILPHLAVILAGDDPASLSFIRQKEEWCKAIGGLFSLIHYPSNVNNEEIINSVKHLNADPQTHAIVIQQPLPAHINKQKLIEMINTEKDIDGFQIDSPFTVPVAAAVLHILKKIYLFTVFSLITAHPEFKKEELENDDKFTEWLKSESIVIIGKGGTGGYPIIKLFQKKGLKPVIIDSKTKDPGEITKNADIIITTVGKHDIIKPAMLKKGVILLGVGVYKGEDGKLHGDYVSDDIQNIASYYTPITGGVGPVNVAYLLSNLVQAAETHPLIR